jgi:hypothetical protein
MGNKMITRSILVRKLDGKRPLGIFVGKWEDNIHRDREEKCG